MEYYHSFGSMKAADMDAKITSPKSFCIAVIKILELVNTWGKSEEPSSLKYPYLYIDTTRLKRAFIVKSNQIVSFAFPFAIYTKTDALGKVKLKINYWDKQLNDVVISHAMSIAQTLNLTKTTYAAQARGIDLTDNDKLAGARAFEAVLALEPSYIRYDFDSKSCKGREHPLYHFDINYSGDYTYKIGLYGEMKEGDMMEIMKEDADCWYVRPYSRIAKVGHGIKRKLIKFFH